MDKSRKSTRASHPGWINMAAGVKVALLAMGLSAFVAPAEAGYGMYCEGKISYLGSDNGGGVVVALAGIAAIHTICSTVTQGSFQIVPQACKQMYATLLAARMNGASVQVYYSGLTSCSEITPWSIQATTYFVSIS